MWLITAAELLLAFVIAAAGVFLFSWFAQFVLSMFVSAQAVIGFKKKTRSESEWRTGGRKHGRDLVELLADIYCHFCITRLRLLDFGYDSAIPLMLLWVLNIVRLITFHRSMTRK